MEKRFKENEIIILLGAGASCDAQILNALQMNRKIEEKINYEWNDFKDLYHYIKSIHFQKQIFKGINPKDIGFNIENLVSLLDIIISIENKTLESYVFVGGWEKDLLPYLNAQKDKQIASKFKESIVKELRGDWLMPEGWEKASRYYERLISFGKELESNLKIFTLNYDLCVEENLKKSKLELGFDDENSWNFRRYDYNDTNNQVDFYLYKLHGSINWKKTKEDRLIKTVGDISPENLAIIFGISNKLQSYDPYLFYFYEFREHCINAKVLVVSGYSFMDTHINDVIKQGFKESRDKKLVINNLDANEDFVQKISEQFKIDKSNIKIFPKIAKDFFNDDLKLATFQELFSEETEETDTPF